MLNDNGIHHCFKFDAYTANYIKKTLYINLALQRDKKLDKKRTF